MLAVPVRAADVAVTSDADAGPGSLRAAFATAAAGDKIAVSVGAGDRMITLAEPLPPPAGDVTLDFGDLPGSVTIAGASLMLARDAGLVMAVGPHRRVVLEIVIAGNGRLTLAGGGTLELGRTATYLGGTTIVAGTLRVAPGGGLPPGGALVLDGGVFDLGGADAQLGGLAGRGGEITLGGRTLSVDQDQDTTFAGVILGKGRLVKEGEGRLTLKAPQAWTGGTTIAGGVLELAGEGGGLHLNGPLKVTGGSLVAPGITMGSGKR